MHEGDPTGLVDLTPVPLEELRMDPAVTKEDIGGFAWSVTFVYDLEMDKVSDDISTGFKYKIQGRSGRGTQDGASNVGCIHTTGGCMALLAKYAPNHLTVRD